MLESLSVRKPYTVLVGVIIAIALGVVSMMNMSLDLLPNLSLPYLVVVTAYPGASPEKVESEVCIPIEQSLGTISGVTQVQSVCSENFGIVQLEFEDGTNLDSAMVKVSGALNNLESTLPDDCGTPNIMEISMDMLASMYVGVSKEGADIYELSDYVKNTLTPFLERRGGVASITEVGLVEKTIQVDLNKKKIDELNDRILEMTDKALAEAADQLIEARKQVTDAKAMLDEQEKQFGSMVSSGIFGQASGILTGAIPAVRIMIQLVIDRLGDVRNGIYDAAGQAAVMQDALAQSAQRQSDAIDKVNEAARAVDEARAAYNQAQKDYLASYPSYFDRPYEGAVDAQVIMDGDPGFSSDDSELFTSDDVYTGQEYASEPDSGNPFTSDEAGLRVQAVEEARQELARAQEQLAQATSEMTQSMNAGSGEAAEGGFTSGQQLIPEEASELEQLIDGLKEAMELVNSVSVSDVVSGVTSLISLIPRIESALTAVSVWDAAGVLDTVISNAGSGLSSLSQSLNGLPELLKGLETAYAALTQGQLDAAMQFTIASIGLSSADSQLAQAEDQYESAREQALANANMNALLSATTLSQMIYAQNFAMPAGYVDDKEDHSWLLKVGDEYEDSDELARTLLADIDDLGPIRLSDVADVTMIDNSGESFARLNGDHAVLLSIFKSPAAGTNQVSHEMQDAFKELQKRDPDVHIVELMDQGSYIDIIVGDIVQSMLGGAFLAFLVLAVFLRDIRPTILVAISIPLSLMAALVMMYFSGLSLNIMTLAGLALGIGMLVDNSVVVMENIFRLRAQGLDAPRAAVQGARQVAGSIIASTLTTICVFLPLVFTDGMVHELMVPMGLSIGYCLLASLITAMTVVPAAGSTILRRRKDAKKKRKSWILRVYERTLRFCLRRKLLILTVVTGLLVFCVYEVMRMGIVILPAMGSNQIQVTIQTPETDTREQSHEKAASVLEAIMPIEGIEDVGVMDSSGLGSTLGGAMGGGDSFGSYTCMITLPQDATVAEVERISGQVMENTADIDCIVTASGSGMSDLSAFTSGNLSINIYGQDLDTLRGIGRDVAKVIGTVKGFVDINDGSQEVDPTLHLVIDRDKAMALGITTAQIYMKIMEGLTTSVTSTKIRYQGDTMDVVIHDGTDPLTVENILDIEFDTSSGLGSGSSMAAMMGGGGSAASSMAAMMGGGGSAASSMAAMMGSGTSAASGMASMMGSGGIGAAGAGDSSLSGSGAMGMDSSALGSLAAMFGMGEETQEPDPEAAQEETEPEKEETTVHRLGEFASLEETDSLSGINRRDSVRYLTVTAAAGEGYNTTLLSRQLTGKLDEVKLPDGYSLELAGESEEVNEMLVKMGELAILSLLFIYLIMVAQFQGLLSPMIVMFTIPLAFTGGMIGLLVAGKQLDMLSLMGFVILMGTVVNNGIVFVDYTNQLRIGGLDRRTALVAAGSTRMRPIMMTALTTILAMVQMIASEGMGSQMAGGMALVIASGLLYSTFMTLYIVPVMYDIFYKKQPLLIEVGDNLDDVPDDAAQYLASLEEEAHHQK